MDDVLLIALAVAFFVASIVYVAACQRLGEGTR
jgi:hypothetical protein